MNKSKGIYMRQARAYNQQAFRRPCPICNRRTPCAVDAHLGTFRCLICGTDGLTPHVDETD